MKKSFITGVLIGSAVAGIATLLTAPKKGSELRGDAQEKFEEVKGKTQEVLAKLKEKVTSTENIEVEAQESIKIEVIQENQEETQEQNN